MLDIRPERLANLARACLLKGDYTLSSGQKRSYYFDGRRLTLSSKGLMLVAEMVWDSLCELELPIDAIGGPTLGADPIVAGTMMVAYLNGKQLDGFLVRPRPKEHGTQGQIEGCLRPGANVVIVDDTTTTGTSALMAIEAAENRECRVAKVIVVLDWQQGGSEELREHGYNFQPLLIGDIDKGVISPFPKRPH